MKKLWQRISLICAVVLILIVAACSTLLLLESKNSILDMTISRAKEKQSLLSNSFSTMANYYSSGDTNKAATISLVQYCFSKFADDTGVLIYNGEEISSSVVLSPETILPLTSYTQQMYLGETGGRNVLIVGNKTTVRGMEYSVYTVEDISEVYNAISQMIWRFILISCAGIIAGVLLIVFSVRHATKPLKRLGETTGLIAAGQYNERAVLSSHDEVGQLANDFNLMADAVQNHVAELTETAERQRLFIGGVTHEFKTPLATMIIHSDTLLNANMSREAMHISLEHIRGQCKWLERLIQKLLKLITLNEDIETAVASVKSLFDDVRESMTETLAVRGTPLIVECENEVFRVDADLMRSAIINLVDNASKASNKGQEITLRAHGRTIEVIDHGKGIPRGEIDRITEPFYMVDRSRNKKLGGSGLGMALVKEIVFAHHAELIIESEQGAGTTVKIIFPDNNSLMI